MSKHTGYYAAICFNGKLLNPVRPIIICAPIRLTPEQQHACDCATFVACMALAPLVIMEAKHPLEARN